jgi:hypothetical protein
VLKANYVDQIEQLAHERHSQLSICKCRLCRVEFLTAKSNFSRSDLLCVFGCRERQRKRSSRARSRKRNQTPEGKRKKRVLNQRRGKRGRELAARPGAGLEYRRQYYRWLIWLIDGVRLANAELSELILSILEKVRSRGLDRSSSIGDIPDW